MEQCHDDVLAAHKVVREKYLHHLALWNAMHLTASSLGPTCERAMAHSSLQPLLQQGAALGAAAIIPLCPVSLPELDSALSSKWCRAVCHLLDEQVTQVHNFWFAGRRKPVEEMVANVKMTQASLAQMKEDIKVLEEEVISHTAELATLKQQSIEALQNLMELQLGQLVAADVQTIMFWLLTMQTVSLKLKVLETDFLAETYTEHSMPALRCIYDQLQNKCQQLEDREKGLDRQLAAYEGAGQQLTTILQEYRNVREDMQKAQWMVHQMRGAPDVAAPPSPD